jgi:glycosyltransferase involved in cell wall biosynthesis
MREDGKEIWLFPVGPLNVRLELAKRIRLNQPEYFVTVLLSRREKEEKVFLEGISASFRPSWRILLSHIGKPAVIPFYSCAWDRNFLVVIALAYLSGSFPLLICKEGSQPLGEKATSFFKKNLTFLFRPCIHYVLACFFQKNLTFLFRSRIYYVLARIVRNCLPLIAYIQRKPRPVRMSEKNWLMIPVYPDVSHHFIYQQVLHLSRLVPSQNITVVKGDLKYRASYMDALDPLMKYLPAAENLRMAALKSFLQLAFTRSRKLLEACLEIERGAREEGEDLWSWRRFLVPFNPLCGFALYGLSKGQIPKSVHTYGLTIPTNYGMIFSMIFDIPHTATYYIDIPQGIPLCFFKLKGRRLKKVIVHTRHCIQELEDLTGIPREKITYVPFGTSVEGTNMTDRANQSLELLAIGRLIPKKGFNILVEACNILKRRERNFRCVIVGDGPELPRLKTAVTKAQLDGWIFFAGEKNYDEYLSLLKPYKILVQPSIIAESGDHDGVPSVILDAMARGLMVIGTRVGGIPEAIRDGENGFLVPPNDPEALADCIERLIVNPEISHKISPAARSTILQDYDAKNLSKKMAEECGFIGSGATAEWWK